MSDTSGFQLFIKAFALFGTLSLFCIGSIVLASTIKALIYISGM